MKLYLKIYINSQGASTLEIIKIAEKMGFSPSVGDYDFVIDFETPEEYGEILEELHRMLKGTKALYTVSGKKSSEKSGKTKFFFGPDERGVFEQK